MNSHKVAMQYNVYNVVVMSCILITINGLMLVLLVFYWCYHLVCSTRNWDVHDYAKKEIENESEFNSQNLKRSQQKDYDFEM